MLDRQTFNRILDPLEVILKKYLVCDNNFILGNIKKKHENL